MMAVEYASSKLPLEACNIWHSIFGDVLDQAPYGAVYSRVSSGSQAERRSLPSQLRELLTRAKDERVFVRPEHIFYEVHPGDELWERPELTRMRGLFNSRLFDRVYFHAVDRFARKAFYADLVLDEARRAGIDAQFVTQQFGTTLEGRRTRQEAACVAERELDSLRERTARGKRERLRAGKPYGAGKAPYGYVWIDGPNQARDRHAGFAIDPVAAPIVQRIFTQVAQGRGMRAICRDLIRDGIPTPKGRKIWQTATLSVILKQDLYTGEAWANKWTVSRVNGKRRNTPRPRDEWVRLGRADAPPLISPELFATVQQVTSQNRELSSRINGKSEEFLLRGGFLRCCTCDGVLVSRRYPSLKGYTVYICHGGRHGKLLPAEQRERVKQPSVSTRLIDMEVWRWMCRLITDEGYLERHLVRLDTEDVNVANLNAIDARLVTLANEIANYAAAIEQARNALVVTTLTDSLDNLAEQQTALHTERERVLDRRSSIAKANAHIDSLRKLRSEPDRHLRLQEMPYLLRQRTLASLGVRVTIHPRERGDRKPLPPFTIHDSIPLGQVMCDGSRLWQ
jgi:DNA invertase Pin-like site-specific DNA recombinase